MFSARVDSEGGCFRRVRRTWSQVPSPKLCCFLEVILELLCDWLDSSVFTILENSKSWDFVSEIHLAWHEKQNQMDPDTKRWCETRWSYGNISCSTEWMTAANFRSTRWASLCPSAAHIAIKFQICGTEEKWISNEMETAFPAFQLRLAWKDWMLKQFTSEKEICRMMEESWKVAKHRFVATDRIPKSLKPKRRHPVQGCTLITTPTVLWQFTNGTFPIFVLNLPPKVYVLLNSLWRWKG